MVLVPSPVASLGGGGVPASPSPGSSAAKGVSPEIFRKNVGRIQARIHVRSGFHLYRRTAFGRIDSMYNVYSLSISAMCTQYKIHTGSNVYTVYTCYMIENMHTMGIVIPPFDLFAVPGRLQLQGGISASAIAFDKGVPSWWCLPPCLWWCL